MHWKNTFTGTNSKSGGRDPGPRFYRGAALLPLAALCLGSVLGAAGCTALKPQPAADILQLTEPELGTKYFLYKPSHYKKTRSWPLLVLCHGLPWESPRSVIMDWAQVAEEKGLILLAPKLTCTREWPPARDKQQQAQQHDEETTLLAVQHVRAACRVADDKVFISGLRGGARAALYIGLRNPDIFRMIAAIQPHVDSAQLVDTQDYIDVHQNVLLVVGMGDVGKKKSEECLDWLRSRKIPVAEDRSAAKTEDLPGRAYDFMRNSLLRHPWIVIKAYQTASPMQLRFSALTSFEDVHKYEWEFGDGNVHQVAHPEHTYAQPGVYSVRLKIHPNPNVHYIRRIEIRVPSDYIPPGS